MTSTGFRIAVRMIAAPIRGRAKTHHAATATVAFALLLQAAPLAAQQPVPMRPGEAFVTRFSGATNIPGPGGTSIPVINPGGVVGSVLDLRNPNQPPQGQHWIGEPQRLMVTAADVGQVFGVALDNSPSPNIFLAATAAFGLHRMPDNAQWQPGMWGSGGGPGTIYRVGPATNYLPQPFAQITLGGRANTGASLGNIAYDRWNRQLYVSDMETGMIHRIRATDGADLGSFDHGMRGRTNFFDAQTGQQSGLPPVPFDPATRARIADCPTGRFENSPECWNLAPNGRRVWGVGVWRNSTTNEVRMYYAAWSSPAFDPEGWLAADDANKRNSVWSVGIGADGAFIASSVRREFLMPDFFVGTEDISRAGFSQPVSDIAFPACPGLPLMLVAERGGLRNLGLGEQSPFATPHEARAIRYELHQDGVWRPIGRYEIGFYDRANEGEPRMRANCAGAASFGPGYSNRWSTNQNQPDNFVWVTGDSLCSPDGPCNLAASSEQESGDDSEVHGIQGLREDFYDEVAPASAYGLAPEQQDASGQTTSVGPDEAYLVDVNINMTPAGAPIVEEFVRNDTTLVGDIAVFQVCAIQAAGVVYPLPPAPVLVADPGHDANFSHARYGSHGQQQSHYRFASHWPTMSHQRFGSHNQYWSHYHYASHNLKWSHNRFGSHGNKASHNKLGSHQPVASHFAKASKIHILAASHKQFGSHNAKQSLIDKIKIPDPKPVHTLAKSAIDKIKVPEPKHAIVKSALDKDIKIPGPKPVHTLAKSAADKGLKMPEPVPVHTVAKSAMDKGIKIPEPKPAHAPVQSAIDKGVKIPEPKPVHAPAKSAADKIKLPEAKPVHAPAQSAIDKGVKIPEPKPVHAPAKSAADKIKLPEVKPAHAPAQSAIDKGVKIPAPKPVHAPAKSAADKIKLPEAKPVHAPAQSNIDKAIKTPDNKGPIVQPKDAGQSKSQPQLKMDKLVVPQKAPAAEIKKPPVQQLQNAPAKPKVERIVPVRPKHDTTISAKEEAEKKIPR